MTAKTKDGTLIFKDSKIYMPQATTYCDEKMVYGAHRKVGYIRDTSLQPLTPKKESFDIKIPKDIRTVDVIVDLKYEVVPGNIIPIHKITRQVTLDK
ncbi:MAG: hypothetical protein ACYS8Y_09345 [Planctomycetota bacterium]